MFRNYRKDFPQEDMIPMNAKTVKLGGYHFDLEQQQVEQRQQFPPPKRSLLLLFGSAAILAFLFVFDTTAPPLNRNLAENEIESQVSKKEVSSDGDDSRPVMNTFFSIRSDTGLYIPSHKYMRIDPLRQWEQAWQDAGWDTRVLTLEDAKKHPDFEHYSTALSAIPNSRKGSYDYMCFMRWLAMAASEQDAFMSDYDTFPLGGINPDLGYNLPNDGKFTSYQRHVPALLSGTASEWNRVARRVLDVALEHVNERFYSDMLALRDLYYQDVVSYIQEMKLAAYPYSKKDVVACEIAKKSLAAHLSHSDTDRSTRAGLIRSGTSRGNLGLALMDQFKAQCLNGKDDKKVAKDSTTSIPSTKKQTNAKISKKVA